MPHPISTANPYVFAEDLDESSLEKVKSICAAVFTVPPATGNLYGELAKRIRVELDKEMAAASVEEGSEGGSVMPHRGWNVVVGRSFGAYVTQKIKCYAYLSVFPGVNILVWKA